MIKIPLNIAKYIYNIPISLAFVEYNHLFHQSARDTICPYSFISVLLLDFFIQSRSDLKLSNLFLLFPIISFINLTLKKNNRKKIEL